MKNINLIFYYLVLHILANCCTWIWTEFKGLRMGESSAIFFSKVALLVMFTVKTKHPTQSQETLRASITIFWFWKSILITGWKQHNIDDLCEGSCLYSQLIEIVTVALSRAAQNKVYRNSESVL